MTKQLKSQEHPWEQEDLIDLSMEPPDGAPSAETQGTIAAEDHVDKIDVRERSQRRTDPDPTNSVIIVIMGVTGSGKSTFISLLADEAVEVGHSLHAHTSEVNSYTFTFKNKTVFLLDTPGFDDTTRSDADLLKDIAYLLNTFHVNQFRLIGVIYLHRITDPRVGGTALKNLNMFQKLCGVRSFPSVILATTMWADLEQSSESGRQLGIRRQDELEKQFWGSMISSGARAVMHDGSAESARHIVLTLVEQNATVVLDIVHQMVVEQRSLDETEAGKYMEKELREAREKLQRDMADLQEGMEEAMQEHDEKTMELIRNEREQAKEMISRQSRESESLKMSMEQLAQDRSRQFSSGPGNLDPSRPQLGDQNGPSRQDSARDKKIRELEQTIREKELQHREAMARQQVEQQSQTAAQLQNIRIAAEGNARARQQMQRELDYERSMRAREQVNLGLRILLYPFKKAFSLVDDIMPDEDHRPRVPHHRRTQDHQYDRY